MFSQKHRILLSINLIGKLYVCLFVLCGAEMYSSFTTKALPEVNEQKISRCTVVLQTWHILQEAAFCKNRTLCCIWAQIFQLVCVDFSTNRNPIIQQVLNMAFECIINGGNAHSVHPLVTLADRLKQNDSFSKCVYMCGCVSVHTSERFTQRFSTMPGDILSGRSICVQKSAIPHICSVVVKMQTY